MATSEKVVNVAAMEDGSAGSSNGSMDADARRLAEMGYTEGMQRNHSVISVLGIGFSLTNSWWAVSAAFITGIYSGGPVLLIYGILGLFLISICVGTSLSELVSAYPNAAGQSFWASELAPKKYSKIASYVTGYFAWAGSIFACASVALSVGFALVGCYVLSHPGFEFKVWHVFLAYQVVNIFSFIFNCHGKSLPLIAKISLYTSLLSFVVILITVPAAAPTHESAKFVFATFINSTGWKNSGIAFIVGLINANWGFSCLDTAVHLAEEVHRPEKMIPVAIMGTVTIGFITSWFFSISMMFSINHFAKIAGTATGVPMLELFYQALQNKGGAIFLECLVIATGFGCMIACQTWASRLLWSFARDRGVPAHRWLGQINEKLDVPLNAHLINTIIVAALGCLYIASYAAINAIISGCIVLPYLSYSIPIICLLIRGRNNITHGPFWLGKFGHFSNYVSLAWILFTFVMYSFPSYMPAQADSMNYVSAAYFVVFLIIVVDWFARARKSYRSKDDREETAEELIGGK